MSLSFSISSPRDNFVKLLEEKCSTIESLSSREDLFTGSSREDLASDAEVKKMMKRERQKKNSVVHPFPRTFLIVIL